MARQQKETTHQTTESIDVQAYIEQVRLNIDLDNLIGVQQCISHMLILFDQGKLLGITRAEFEQQVKKAFGVEN
jgi:hypothetical protein